MKRLQLFLLGGFRLLLDGKVVSLDADKSKALLAYLALEGATPQPRARLAALLWSDQSEEKASHSLRQTLSGLRKALGETEESSFLQITREEVQLNLQAPIETDAVCFERNLDKALYATRRESLGRQRLDVRALIHVVDAYEGTLLSGISLSGSDLFEEWLLIERERFERKAIEALTLLADYYQRRGQFGQARQLAERLVRIAPWDEHAHALLIRLLAIEGQNSAALAQYRAVSRYLWREMGVQPMEELQGLYQAICRGDAVQPAIAVVPQPHLPDSDLAFVGRSKILDELSTLMADPNCRLLVLLGVGGIGKTRLALEVLRMQVGLFADGVYFVGLTDVAESRLLASVLAEVIGYRFFGTGDFVPQMLNFLSGKEMLIVLDNYEHLLPADEQAQNEAMVLIGQILQQAPGVKLLVTSRAPLKLRSEIVLGVEGLDVGDGAEEAIALFEQVAGRVGVDVKAEREVVAQVCKLLQGSPLAIELTAGWTRSLSCAQIFQQVQADLGFVSASQRDALTRHRSLRAVFEHSWRLLPPYLRAVLQALSVFQGGFTKLAAVQLAEATEQDLQALMEWGLVQFAGDGRWDLHNLVRQFANEKLVEEPEKLEQATHHHALFYLSWLGEQYSLLLRDQQLLVLDSIAVEMENVRAAWRWAIENQDEGALERAVDGLALFLEMRSWYVEGQRIFADLAAASKDAFAKLFPVALSYQAVFEVQLGNYAKALALIEQALPMLQGGRLGYAWMVRGRALLDLQDYKATQDALDKALHLSRESGRVDVEAMALLLQGHVGLSLGQYDEAERYYQESLTMYRSLGDRWGIAKNLGNLAILAGRAARHTETMQYLEESQRLYCQLGDRAGIARSLHNRGNVAYLLGDFEHALALRQECLSICREIGFRWGVVSTLKHLGDVEKVLGQVQLAEQHYQEALVLADELRSNELRLSVLNSLAGLLLMQAKVNAARRTYAEALQIALQAGMLLVGIDVLVGLAETFVGQKEEEQALAWLTFAMNFEGGDQQTRDKAAAVLSGCAGRLSAERIALLQQQTFEALANQALQQVVDNDQKLEMLD
ncbi:MAG: tetratricopeptide repeat protein [Anaerolinea sp.]|nr:tetratricopeptide repeat protein [Anaerolinea sp.]